MKTSAILIYTSVYIIIAMRWDKGIKAGFLNLRGRKEAYTFPLLLGTGISFCTARLYHNKQYLQFHITNLYKQKSATKPYEDDWLINKPSAFANHHFWCMPESHVLACLRRSLSTEGKRCAMLGFGMADPAAGHAAAPRMDTNIIGLLDSRKQYAVLHCCELPLSALCRIRT